MRCEIAKDPSGKYCAKYLGKDLATPTKHLKSKGFGKEAILRKLQEIRKYPRESTFSLLCPLNGKSYDIPITRYVAGLAYPSVARQLPVEYRDLLRNATQIALSLHTNEEFSSEYAFGHFLVEEFLTRYRQPIKLCGFDQFDVTAEKELDYDLQFDNLMYLHSKLKEYDFDFEEVEYLKGLYEEHVTYTNIFDFDIALSSYRAIKNNAVQLRLEKDLQ